MKFLASLMFQLEAAPGFEPGIAILQTAALPLGYAAPEKKWSGKRDLNPRLRPWQGRTLPLSYSRSAELCHLTIFNLFVNLNRARFLGVFGT